MAFYILWERGHKSGKPIDHVRARYRTLLSEQPPSLFMYGRLKLLSLHKDLNNSRCNPMGMVVWACGLNAFNQLHFNAREYPSDPHDFLGDLTQFTPILEDQDIEILRTTMSTTLGKLRKQFASYFLVQH